MISNLERRRNRRRMQQRIREVVEDRRLTKALRSVLPAVDQPERQATPVSRAG